jgi:hypothetical protein
VKGGKVIWNKVSFKNVTYYLHFFQLYKFTMKRCYATIGIFIHTTDSDMKLSNSTHRIHWCVSTAKWLRYVVPKLPILCYLCTLNGSLGYIKKLFMFVNIELWSTLKETWYLIWRNFPVTVGNNAECSNTLVTFACVQLNTWTCSFIPDVKVNRFDNRLFRLKTDESWYSIWSYTQFRKTFLAMY